MSQNWHFKIQTSGNRFYRRTHDSQEGQPKFPFVERFVSLRDERGISPIPEAPLPPPPPTVSERVLVLSCFIVFWCFQQKVRDKTASTGEKKGHICLKLSSVNSDGQNYGRIVTPFQCSYKACKWHRQHARLQCTWSKRCSLALFFLFLCFFFIQIRARFMRRIQTDGPLAVKSKARAKKTSRSQITCNQTTDNDVDREIYELQA